MSHCGSCKYDPQSIACYAANRPRLCELIHVLGREDYEAEVDELTLNPPPPPPIPDDLDGFGFEFEQQAMTANVEGEPKPRFDRVAWEAKKAAVAACPHRTNALPCGCSARWHCALGKGHNPDGGPVGVVTDHDCLACVGGG